jgi:uncharacterized repeat protein (TIGR03803 family)
MPLPAASAALALVAVLLPAVATAQSAQAQTFTTLYRFCSVLPGCTDGEYTYAGLVQATDGSFYGTTVEGGANEFGTVFKITPSGTLTTLHSFCSVVPGCKDGENPLAGLIQATDGDFYGTTYGGAPAAMAQSSKSRPAAR